MALHPCQALAPFAIPLARNSVAFFFAPFTGTIKRVDLAVSVANANGDSVFNVRINGVSQWPVAGDRPKIAASALKGNKTGLSIAVVEGDLIQIDATGVPTGGITGPVMMQLLIEDNVPPTGAASGDLTGEYPGPVVDGLKGRSLGGLPEVAGFKADNFNDNSFDTALWDIIGTTGTETNGRYELTFGSNGVQGLQWGDSSDMTNHWASFRLGSRGSVTDGLNVEIGIQCESGAVYGYLYFLVNSSLQLRAIARDGSNGVLENVLIATYDPAVHVHMRVRNVGASQWAFETSVDGSTWTLRHTTAALNASYYGATRPWKAYASMTGSGAQTTGWVDDANSDVPEADAIIGKNLFALMWDNANDQFSLLKALGMIKTTSGAPVGAPADLPTGYTEARYDQAAHIMYVWNGAAWDSQAF